MFLKISMSMSKSHKIIFKEKVQNRYLILKILLLKISMNNKRENLCKYNQLNL